MRLTPTSIPGAWIVDIEPHWDERGLFARTFGVEEFTAFGLSAVVAQCSTSFNPTPGTLRGLHFQAAPYAEARLVRCTRGAVYDVAVDLRVESATFLKWVSLELTADNRRMLYIPEGCAHGFMTLCADTEVYYQISAPYRADATSGVRWDDPAFGVEWPLRPSVLSDRDAQYPDFRVVSPG